MPITGQERICAKLVASLINTIRITFIEGGLFHEKNRTLNCFGTPLCREAP